MKKTIFIMLALSYSIIINYSCNKEEDKKDEPITTFTDTRDGQVYKTVKIGNQTWMAENLDFDDGVSRCYNFEAGSDVYGRLYTWNTAFYACPSGWHLPTDAEWDVLINYLGGESTAGAKMKESGTTHWNSPNTGATNSSGFTALPGGFITCSNDRDEINEKGYWWSSTADTTYSDNAWTRTMVYNDGFIQRYSGSRKYAYSIRCVKD